MFRYTLVILVLLLINATYRSLGNPINPPIAKVLTALAGHCENAFLVNQIKSKIMYCSELSSIHLGDKQLQCLTFYDINRQLCAAVNEARIGLPEKDYTAKINEEQDVNTLCLTTKDWVFSNLTECLLYKQIVDKVFKHAVTCSKLCGVEDFLSDDANFFCKYFKWGTDIMTQQVTNQENLIDNAQVPPQDANEDNKAVVSAPASSDLQDVQIMVNNSTDPKLNAPTPVKKEDSSKVDSPKPETSSLAVNQNILPSEPASLPNIAAAPEKLDNADTNVDKPEGTGVMPQNVPNANGLSSKSPEGTVPKVDSVPKAVSKPVTLEVSQHKSDNAEKTNANQELQQLNSSEN